MSLEAHRGEWFVVKVGGELALDRSKLAATVGHAVKAFLEAGVKVCVVHGGGPQATLLQQRLGLETQQVGGRRITDAATLEVMKMSVAGQVSVDVASAFAMAKVPAFCTTGVSAGIVEAKRRAPMVVSGGPPTPVDFGLVGDVTGINTVMLEKLAAAGAVPVIGSLGGDAEGNVYNINADTIAVQIARALRARKLLLVSNVPGVLADKNDPSTRIARLTPALAKEKILSGAIVGGMIPKVEESLEILQQGIGAVHIVGLDPPSAILEEAASPGSRGTVFVNA